MKSLKEYINENLTGAAQLHLYLMQVLASIDGKEWDKSVAEFAKKSTVAQVQVLDLKKNPSLEKLTTLDTEQPILIFPDFRTTVKETDSFKFDKRTQELLKKTGLDFECCKYCVLLGKPGNKVKAEPKSRNIDDLTDKKKGELTDMIHDYVEKIPVANKVYWISNHMDEFNEFLKKYSLKIGGPAVNRGRYTNYNVRNLQYKGKKVGVINFDGGWSYMRSVLFYEN